MVFLMQLTAKQLSELTGLSCTRISKLTNGYKQKKYEYDPVLIEGTHYTRIKTNIVYNKSALEILSKVKKYKKYLA